MRLHPCHAHAREGCFLHAFWARVSQELALITTPPDAALLYANLTNSTVDPKFHAAQVAYAAVRAKVNKTGPNPVCKAVDKCVAPALVAQEMQISLLNAVGSLNNANMGAATVNGNAGNPYLSPTINYGNRENAVEFNASACLQKSYLNFGTSARKIDNSSFEVGHWNYIAPQPLSRSAVATCGGIIPDIANSPTCATYCARRAKVCDPCAMALAYSCADGIWNAVLQSGSPTSALRDGSTMYSSNSAPPFGGTCAGNGSVASLGPQSDQWNPLPGLTMQKLICSQNANNGLTASFFGAPKNFWNPNQNNYLDPATACDLPVWDLNGPSSRTGLSQESSGALCFCTSTIYAPPRVP